MKKVVVKTIPACTRIELLACIGAAALLLTIIIPTLANTATRSDRVACLNNLRQIGNAYSHFGLEDRLGRAPWRVGTAEGGNSDTVFKNNLAWQFSVISNSLESPKYLADPGDPRRSLNPAQHWGLTAGGLLNAGWGNNALSYWLGLDGSFRLPRTILSGDRNLLADPNVTGCSSGISPSSAVSPSGTVWTNDVHGLSGNVLFFDGSTAQLDSAGVRTAFSEAPGDDNRRQHALFPF